MEAQHILHQGSDPQTASVTFHDCPFSNIMEDNLSAAKLQHVKVVFRDASCALPISTRSPVPSEKRLSETRDIKKGTPQNSVNTSPNIQWIQCEHTGVHRCSQCMKAMLTALWQMH